MGIGAASRGMSVAGLLAAVAFAAPATAQAQTVVNGYTCTVVGTAGNDSLAGGKATDDVICGLGGNDTLTGLGGNDVLFGGDGNDSLLGGRGDDHLDGGNGRDTAGFYDSGIMGVEIFLLSNYASGPESGNDSFAASSVENIDGSPGDDRLFGDDQNNVLDGRGGSDLVSGGDGNDTVIGGAGDDDLSGKAGNDALQPGPGEDYADGGSFDETGFGDTVLYNDAPSGVTVGLSPDSETMGGGAAAPDVLFGFESVTGSRHDDILSVADPSRANRLMGGAGNDTLDLRDSSGGPIDGMNAGDGLDNCGVDSNDVFFNCEGFLGV